jgi:hypothetical protein
MRKKRAIVSITDLDVSMRVNVAPEQYQGVPTKLGQH